MRFLLRVLAMTLVFSSVSFSQSLTYDPFVLAGADVFSRNLIPLLPDTASQILFLPSRAFSTDRRFVYSTYLPSSLLAPIYYTYYNPGPATGDYKFPVPVYYLPAEYVSPRLTSVAALWGDESARTLLQVRHVLSENGIENNSSEKYHGQYSGYKDDRESSYKSSNSSRGSTVDLKLTRIVRSGASSQALGGWILVQPAGYDHKYNSVSSSTTMWMGNSPSTNLMFNQSDGTYTSDFSTYAVGVEYSLSSPTTDWRVAVSVGKTSANDHQDIVRTDSSGNLSGTSLSSNRSYAHSYFETKSNPMLLGVELYYSTNQELFGLPGRFFQHVAAGYGSGDASLDLLMEQQSSNNGTVGSRTTASKQTTEEQNTQTGSFESGWMLQRRAGNLTFVTGMEGQFGYAKSKAVSFPYYYGYPFSNYDGLRITTQTSYRGAIVTPLVVVYNLADWVSIIGGFNHTWSYERTSNSSSSRLSTLSTSDTTSRESASDQTNTYWSSGVAKYLSIILTTSEGLRIHIGFTGNLTNYQEWKISAGYLF